MGVGQISASTEFCPQNSLVSAILLTAALIAAGGWVAVVIILLICVVILVAGTIEDFLPFF